MKKLLRKYGAAQVLRVVASDRGGLAFISTPNHGSFWVRASRVGCQLWT